MKLISQGKSRTYTLPRCNRVKLTIDHWQVYDIPRAQQKEAVYINKGFDEEPPTYDTPRKKVDTTFPPGLDDHIECEYDVPKEGDNSSTSYVL